MMARPCGTSATSTAAAWTEAVERIVSPDARSASPTGTAARIVRSPIARMSVSRSRRSGVRSSDPWRASVASRLANVASPTSVASIAALPATHTDPERRRSPGTLATASASPVRIDSSASRRPATT